MCDLSHFTLINGSISNLVEYLFPGILSNQGLSLDILYRSVYLMIIFYFSRQHDLCLQLRDTQNAEYLGEIYLDVTLTPQSREEREQVANA